jgi:co-chaperonin GroES (HSP10)
MKAVGSNVLIEKLVEKEGLIVLPQGVERDYSRGKVISIGSKVESDISVDDIIIYSNRYTLGNQHPTVSVNNEEYIILSEQYVLIIE